MFVDKAWLNPSVQLNSSCNTQAFLIYFIPSTPGSRGVFARAALRGHRRGKGEEPGGIADKAAKASPALAQG